MVDLIVKLITPIVVGMGASASDVQNYANMLRPQLNAILIGLLVMIVVMIAAHFVVKKETHARHVIRWTAAMAWLLVVLIMVNSMTTNSSVKSIIENVISAPKIEFSDDVVAHSKEIIEKVGDEGIVLVKNKDLLPLDTTKVNVFGWASCFPVYSGTGSASAGEAGPAVSIMGSLRDAGFETNSELMQLYLNYSKEFKVNRPSITMQKQDWTLPEPTKDKYTTSLLDNAKSHSDTAIIVIARSGGENADLPTDMNAVIKGTYNLAENGTIDSKFASNYGYTGAVYVNNSSAYDDFEPGEHYLELSRTEEDMVDVVCSNFKNVIVVVNANNAMELDWVDKYDNIGAVLLVPGTGSTGMTSLGKVLNGTVNPSGRTVDTYLKDLTKAPTWNHANISGNHLYTNAKDVIAHVGRTDISFQGVVSFTDYVEGIYMGYKFYETAAEEGAIKYEDYVQYPFGYGLSYTSFSQSISKFEQTDEEITVEVTVTNTGTVAGKDVVELYFTPPYTNGGIEKASVNLLDFGKTDVLQPGASETVTLQVPMEDLASYDSSCKKTSNGGYVLEAGKYTISIRKNSHEVIDSKDFTLAADKVYSEGRPSDDVAPVNRFSYMEGDKSYLSRKDKFANLASVIAPHDKLEISKDDQKKVEGWSAYKYKPTDYDNPSDTMPTLGANNGLKLASFAGKSYDDPEWEKLLDQLTVDDMVKLINTAGWNTAEIESVGKVRSYDFDGPSGYSNYLTGAMGTQFCTEVLLAQTWNKALAEQVGDGISQEFAQANSYGWYGPGLNLHRTAFSGRNFEYYSEDGVLSGKMASAEINGAAKFGVYSFMKHFAANDQETNRCAFLMTYMTEQNFRENVLKPFETVVKNFNFERYALGTMTSYNWLGTVPVISCKELLTDVLRGEWGFRGAVISDYNGSYGYQISDAAVRAGNDLMLGQGVADTNQFKDIESPTLIRAMRQACKNVLYTIGNSGYYVDHTAEGGDTVVREEVETVTSGNPLAKILLPVNIIGGIVIGGVELAVLLRWFLLYGKKKDEKQVA